MAQKYMYIMEYVRDADGNHVEDADGNWVEKKKKIPCVSAEDVVWDGKLKARWAQELKSRRSELDSSLKSKLDELLCNFGYNLSSEELAKVRQKLIEKGKWY